MVVSQINQTINEQRLQMTFSLFFFYKHERKSKYFESVQKTCVINARGVKIFHSGL